MREIVFRAYDKTMKRYKPFDGEHDTMLISRDGKIDYYNLQNGSGFDEYILEQFTGLTSKNGKKIFEGDIVLIEGHSIGVIRYLSDEALFAVDFLSHLLSLSNTTSEYIAVIGNIHDNPELLA